MKAILYLEDGKSFNGECDTDVECLGKVIMNTAVVGYQEMITDPANAGKILVFTYPLIGNYGCAPKFSESSKIWVSGLVVKEKSKIYSATAIFFCFSFLEGSSNKFFEKKNKN